MKLFLLLIILINSSQVKLFGQDDLKTNIIGNWSFINEQGKKESLVITNDSWIVESWVQNNEKDWSLFKYTAKYQVMKNNKIRILEEEGGVLKIIELTEDKLTMKGKWRKSKRIEYNKE